MGVVAHDAGGRDLAPIIVAVTVAAYGDRRHCDGCAVVVALHVVMACGAHGCAVGGMTESGARKPAFGEVYRFDPPVFRTRGVQRVAGDLVTLTQPFLSSSSRAIAID